MNDIVDFLPHDMSELLNFICVNILIVFTAVIFTGIYVGIKDIIKGWDRNMVKKRN